MSSRIAAALVGVLAAVAGAMYFSWWSVKHPASASLFGHTGKPKELPLIEFQDGAQYRHSLADFRGKLVLLNVWATWCAPCREEMPTLDRLQAKLGGPQFSVLAVSIDQQGPQLPRKFFDEVGIKALELYNDPSAQVAFKLGAVGLPATLLIDREGRETGRHFGPAQWDKPEIVEELRRRIGR